MRAQYRRYVVWRNTWYVGRSIQEAKMPLTRRSVMKAAALGAAGAALDPAAFAKQSSSASATTKDQFRGLRVGACSYSLRQFPADQALASIKRLGVTYVSV